ncbi:hypothetical protein [Desmospora activa]|uniref:Uncharacterized protein n=1 Tax=Desmospora activa DSM 45169 TaxID=1121389 RepID=A0A2T4Z950_9BACL|nr:hypothetical protein [Desmospora activa]PTM58397.1 hypothetical protein C8J48_0980 [Desmospora activa DSM 45169]
MIKQITYILMIIVFCFPIPTFAHDGETDFPADKIAPAYGQTGAWIDYYLPGYTRDPARYVDHMFVWEEDQGFEAYYPENALKV